MLLRSYSENRNKKFQIQGGGATPLPESVRGWRMSPRPPCIRRWGEPPKTAAFLETL